MVNIDLMCGGARAERFCGPSHLPPAELEPAGSHGRGRARDAENIDYIYND